MGHDGSSDRPGAGSSDPGDVATVREVPAGREAPAAPAPVKAPPDDTTAPLVDVPPEPTFEPPEELRRGMTVGRYLILGPLGRGGMGVVYVADDPTLGRRVAIKVLNRSGEIGSNAVTLHEAQVLAKLAHPNVVSVHDVGTVDDLVFLAMELVDGASMKQWLAAEPRPWREIVDVFRQAGRGLVAAHAVGLVHRDFKPGNVLVGRDGRVRVVDFGVARRVEPGEEIAEGFWVGTERYMAPEQFEGRADARSDQYSFCVALTEALTRADLPLPSDLRAVDALFRTARVPEWLARIARRGLAREPGERYPDMTALLAELDRDRNRRWLVPGIAAAVVVVGAVAAVGVAMRDERPTCTGAERQLAGVWDDTVRGALRQAFLATGRTNAAELFGVTAGALDRYGRSWALTHQGACEATHVRGEQSEARLDLRMRCLDRRLATLRALTGVLTEERDAAVLDRAVAAVTSLTDPSQCMEPELLSARAAAADPASRARGAVIEAQLAQIEALRAAGKWNDGLALGEQAVAAARTLGYVPLIADTLYELAELRRSAGDYAHEETALQDALEAAAHAGDDVLAARCLIELVFVVGYRLDRTTEGLSLARVAEAAVVRAGDPPALRGKLYNNRAAVLFGVSRNDEARQDYERALASYEQAPVRSVADLARVLTNLGVIDLELGDLPHAVEHYERGLAAWKEARGDDHPDTAWALAGMGAALVEQGRYRDARADFAQAIAIDERLLGPDHVELMEVLEMLAGAQRELGDMTGAHASLERSAAIRDRIGKTSRAAAEPLLNRARLLLAEGKLRQATDEFERARAYMEQAQVPADHGYYAEYHHDLGRLARADGHPDVAITHLEQARALREKLDGADHVHTAAVLTALGGAYLDGGDVARAREVLERAVAILDRRAGRPEILGEARFALARALTTGDGRDPDRAVELAGAAEEAFMLAERNGAARAAADRAAVAAWITEFRR